MPGLSRCLAPARNRRLQRKPRRSDERNRHFSRDGRLRTICVAGLWARARGSGRSCLRFMAAGPRECRRARPAPTVSRQKTMTRKQQRLALLVLGMTALAGATALVLVAFNDN